MSGGHGARMILPVPAQARVALVPIYDSNASENPSLSLSALGEGTCPLDAPVDVEIANITLLHATEDGRRPNLVTHDFHRD